MVKVVIIGAGINGLACAIKIQEHYKNSEVVVVSRELSPNTTGDGSGGLWYPYLCGTTSQHLLNKWGSATYNFLYELWFQGGYDICAIPIYYFFPETSGQVKPEWAESVFGYETLKKRHLEYYNQLHNTRYGGGIRFTTFVLHPASFLKYLKERFERANGKILTGNVTSLVDPTLEEYDVVVNCAGLGARYLVPDNTVYPIRGQVSKITAPWINKVIVDDVSGNYVIPNYETCILGGTHQEHDYNTNVNEKDKQFIVDGCKTLFPGLNKRIDIVQDWVGLRPGRFEIRLEGIHNQGKLIIHNYGHGGSGLTLFWGCADTVLELMKEKVENPVNELKSKL